MVQVLAPFLAFFLLLCVLVLHDTGLHTLQRQKVIVAPLLCSKGCCAEILAIVTVWWRIGCCMVPEGALVYRSNLSAIG